MAVSFSRPALPPLPLLSAMALVLLVAIALAAWFALRGPWLGVELQPAGEQGLQVTQVYPEGPLAGRLSRGDHLIAIGQQDAPLSLRHYDPRHNPHAEVSFTGYADYLERQTALARALSADSVTLVGSDGASLTVTPRQVRPLTSLSLTFWLLNLFGLLACLVGLSVWVFLPGHWPARLLALSGSGFFMATLPHSIWSTRELAMPGTTFELLLRVNHVGLHLLLVSLLVLMIVYPRRLKASAFWIGVLLVFALVQQVNENLQCWSLPLHAFYIPLPLYYLTGGGVALVQWHLARHQPLDRGALRWVFLSILLAMGGGMLVYFLPTVLGQPPLVNLTTMVGIASTLYIGFALGILRYRLFQLERWWFIAWAWFLGGLSVLVMDLLVASLLGINQKYALTLSLLAVGWLYFPLRQWFWQRMSVSTASYMERHLPGFVESLFTSAPGEEVRHWRNMLERVFSPLALEPCHAKVSQAQLENNGARLVVPSFGDRAPALGLLYGQHGKRLFSERDRDQADALCAVATRVCNLREARMAGADQERRRIMRDLHDDVGGRLLTLMHTARDSRYENLARGALSALRETIYALDEQRRYNLEDMLVDFRSELDERLAASALEPDWQVSLPEQPLTLPPRYFINLSRVLSEAVSNALQHGAGGKLRVAFEIRDGAMRLQLENDLPANGSAAPASFRGRGLNNTYTRIAELDGDSALYCIPGTPARFCLRATVPVPV